MDAIDEIIKLRPVNDGAVSIREAIERIALKLGEIEHAKIGMRNEVDRAIRAGKPEEIEAADRTLTQTVETERRIRVLLEALRDRLKPAEERDRIEAADLKRLEEQAERCALDFVEAWEQYAPLAEQIRDILLRGILAKRAIQRLREFGYSAAKRGNSVSFSVPNHRGLRVLYSPYPERTIFDLVCLPGIHGGPFSGEGDQPFWFSPQAHARFRSPFAENPVSQGAAVWLDAQVAARRRP